MAPWNRLRSDRAGEKEKEKEKEKEPKKRSSTVGRPPSRPRSRQHSSRPASQHSHPVPEPPATVLTGSDEAKSPAAPATRRNHRTRDSVASLSAVHDASKRTADHAPPRVPLLEVPESTVRPQRFSLLRFRHASDSQLSKTAQHHSDAPPVPGEWAEGSPADAGPVSPPSIITTAPTADNLENAAKRRSTFSLARRSRAFPKEKAYSDAELERESQATPVPPAVDGTAAEAKRHAAHAPPAPPPYGDLSHTALALPVSRASESSRSDGSSGGAHVYAQTTTTHTVSTTTTFFRLPRRKKDKGPLFPLPPKTPTHLSSLTNTPRLSSARDSASPVRQSIAEHSRSREHSPARAAMRRADSRASATSQSSGRPPMLEQRGRSSTLNSLRKRMGEDEPLPTPPLPISTRTSTSTSGRPSLGGLFGVNRTKPNEGLAIRGLRNGDPGTPVSLDSKGNSFHLPREPPVVIPERQEGDTPAKYLARLEEVVNRSALVAILTKSEDEFMRNVLRSYMRRFKFYEEPLDMAIRKLLMYVELPKETQHIDRTMQSFADRYHECNPGIFASADDAYFIAFSILILHTDVFNKNNKRKMTKVDYLKNAQSQGGVSPEVLECFYDNTCYTTFIHLEDEVHIASSRASTPKQPKKSPLKPGVTPKRSQSGPVDPYTLILENRLDTLRPALEDVLTMDDNFNFILPNSTLNMSDLNKSFFRSGVIQILSARSRPEAFMNQATITNPLEASMGVVDIKVTKVGVLWRKDPKRKKTRSPWQEWGAILTSSQLYFFRNTHWVKNLMTQYDHFYRNNDQGPVVFKPPLEQFKPDFLVSLDDAVALVDSRYRKHKNAFLFTRQDAYAEVLLADNEGEYRDWLAKINYAAAFRSAGVRMRGTLGLYEPRKSQETARAVSSASNDSTVPSEDQSRPSTRPDELSEEQQIILARRQIMSQKIQEADARVRGIEKAIESQMRSGRHLKILTPVQQRTREDVTLAALHLAEALRLTQITKWRIRCYRKMLAGDLEDDVNIQNEHDHRARADAKETMSPSTRESEKGRLPFARLGSKHSTATKDSRSRPSQQPTSQKLFSMDEIFRTPSRLRGQTVKSKAAWELPPINFDRRKSTSQTRTPREADEQAIEDGEGSSLKTASLVRDSLRRASSELGPRPEVIDQEEREILVRSGVDPDAVSPEREKDKKKTEEEDIAKIAGLDDMEARAKARHSFQRKLQNTPVHQRSKKGKDSGSTITGTDDGLLTPETQGLKRAAGSFTLHGKKASVVTFGSEWQNISPEEQLRQKRASQDMDKAEVPESAGVGLDLDSEPRQSLDVDLRSPISAVSDIVDAPSFKSARSSFEHPPSFSDDELSPHTVGVRPGAFSEMTHEVESKEEASDHASDGDDSDEATETTTTGKHEVDSTQDDPEEHAEGEAPRTDDHEPGSG